MRKTEKSRFLIAVFCATLFLIAITGCATKTLPRRTATLGESQLTEQSEETDFSLYYDFKDVSVPKEMKVNKDKSFVFQTTEFTAGVLSFSGKVESNSLISYFINKMPNEGWRFLSSFKSPKNILFFLKENRFCIITITGKTFTTDLEILVTPSFEGGS